MTGVQTCALPIAIRERNGWVYAIDLSFNLYSDTGIWAIYFGCSESNYLKCTKLIYNELDKLPGRQDPADFVLSDFPARERGELGVTLEQAADAVEAVVELGFEAAQQRLHSA